ncbi:hypothetical protein KUL42_09950 [Alteromonas sp. KUL42]|uniref:hypothetical protein n=1 Tax=Alteromonas sp. KUL42 TaxID=2480797 RepID=UPI0010361842|nr:hypothetical protein [Alteromonas sp. KUL42]TAP37784.1 hypothetical protein EYR97_04945 [Alteromonas sp. KUL42]GEA06234.1 hypothetical protein KUL42_09950 [Alteromonas sp. KUL42]
MLRVNYGNAIRLCYFLGAFIFWGINEQIPELVVVFTLCLLSTWAISLQLKQKEKLKASAEQIKIRINELESLLMHYKTGNLLATINSENIELSILKERLAILKKRLANRNELL